MRKKIKFDQVRQLFDIEKIREYCTSPSEFFFDQGKVKKISADEYSHRERFLIHKDNDSPILAVAHLDTVAMYRPEELDFNLFRVEQDQGFSTIVQSPNMDDRMGAYILLEILPKLGINADILLCDTEEIGMSTAADFYTKKQYNWLFEFDRAGTDVVMYQYEDDTTRKLLEDNNFIVAQGAFSDICELERLGVKAFNFGTGYYRAHTNECFANLDDCAFMVSQFANFYHKLKDIKLPHQIKRSEPLDY